MTAGSPAPSESGIDPFDLSAPPAAVDPIAPGLIDRIDPTPRAVAAPDEIAEMRQRLDRQQEQIAALTTLLARHSVPVSTTSEDSERISRARQVYRDTMASITKTTAERTQAVVDAEYPRRNGDKVFEVLLKDKPSYDDRTGTTRYEAGVFPVLRIPANRESDVRGRYLEVCGIISSGDAPLAVTEVVAA